MKEEEPTHPPSPIVEELLASYTLSSFQFAKLCLITVLGEDDERDELSSVSTISSSPFSFQRERTASTTSNATSNQTTATSTLSGRGLRGSILDIDWSYPLNFPTSQSPPPIAFQDE
jgi:hypothetical protein